MQSPKGALGAVERHASLNELGLQAGGGELIPTVRSGKESALVLPRIQLDQNSVLQRRRLELHEERSIILSSAGPSTERSRGPLISTSRQKKSASIWPVRRRCSSC